MTPDALKACLAPFRDAAATATPEGVAAALHALVAPGARIRLCHPFGDAAGPEGLIAPLRTLLAAWPNMRMTIAGDGWLGIAPAGQKITLRSLDFWRLEGAPIRENWVLVDLLDMWAQTGVDVLDRMRALAAPGGMAAAA